MLKAAIYFRFFEQGYAKLILRFNIVNHKNTVAAMLPSLRKQRPRKTGIPSILAKKREKAVFTGIVLLIKLSIKSNKCLPKLHIHTYIQACTYAYSYYTYVLNTLHLKILPRKDLCDKSSIKDPVNPLLHNSLTTALYTISHPSEENSFDINLT